MPVEPEEAIGHGENKYTHMIDQKKFEFIKKKYGHYASWAIWADAGKNPKSRRICQGYRAYLGLFG